MDQIKIGRFIASLRKTAGLTQEALGERLGVTNKTISRWENGNYMPDIEMLQLLSQEFGVSLNELLAGERIPEEEYRRKADENISAVLRKQSAFTIEEKTAFYKRKWRRDHLAQIIFLPVILAVVVVLALISRQPLLLGLVPVLGLVGYGYLHNKMMSYVEHSLYD